MQDGKFRLMLKTLTNAIFKGKKKKDKGQNQYLVFDFWRPKQVGRWIMLTFFRVRVQVSKWRDLGINALKQQYDDAFLGRYVILYAGRENRHIPKPQLKMLRTSERCTVSTLGNKIFAVLTFEALRPLNEAVKNSSFSSVLCYLCF